MPPKARAGAAVKKVRRKERKNVAHGQAPAVADAGVAADLDLAANVRGDLAAKVTFNLEIALDVFAELNQLLVREVLGALVQVNRGSGQCLDGTGATDPVDVGERDLHPLLAGEIHAD